MKVLVVDDDPVNRKLLEFSLRQWGHDPVSAKDGPEGLEAFVTTAFDAVITDWMMPNMDGIALARAVRALPLRDYPWIVLLTSKVFRSNYSVAMEAGVDDFLMKPVDRELLRVRLLVASRVLHAQRSPSVVVSPVPVPVSTPGNQ